MQDLLSPLSLFHLCNTYFLPRYWAKDKVAMGREKKSALLDYSTKQMLAYHEGGKALVGMLVSAVRLWYCISPLHFCPRHEDVVRVKMKLSCKRNTHKMRSNIYIYISKSELPVCTRQKGLCPWSASPSSLEAQDW